MTREEAIKNIKEHCYFANLIPQAKEALDVAIKTLEQDPWDCISRAELLKAVDTWDRFGCDAGSSKLVPVKDCYVPYIHYDDVVKAIKGMPSIQPKTGHWIKETSTDMCDEIETYWVCSECGRDVGNGMANLNDVIKDYPYCHCGAKMLPTDSEKE